MFTRKVGKGCQAFYVDCVTFNKNVECNLIYNKNERIFKHLSDVGILIGFRNNRFKQAVQLMVN